MKECGAVAQIQLATEQFEPGILARPEHFNQGATPMYLLVIGLYKRGLLFNFSLFTEERFERICQAAYHEDGHVSLSNGHVSLANEGFQCWALRVGGRDVHGVEEGSRLSLRTFVTSITGYSHQVPGWQIPQLNHHPHTAPPHDRNQEQATLGAANADQKLLKLIWKVVVSGLHARTVKEVLDSNNVWIPRVES
ncbi:hypothetical protein NC652_006129 [Populus alba x Populus x berolinensis]|nr:hypothetical protein NC652_006129 [Populus alba x Populus x berolinensis]